MTEEEFALSLPQNISDKERTRRLEEWRKENPQPEVEEVVEEKPIKLTIESATEPIDENEKLDKAINDAYKQYVNDGSYSFPTNIDFEKINIPEEYDNPQTYFREMVEV